MQPPSQNPSPVWGETPRAAPTSAVLPPLGGSTEEIQSPRPLTPEATREALRAHTIGACRACGLVATAKKRSAGRLITNQAEVWVSEGPGAPRARIVGALYCRSPHGCPVCSTRARETAREQLREVVSFWRAAQGDVLLLTLTIRHRRGHALGTMLDILGAAWDYMIRRAAWRHSMTALGLTGHCHVLEPTYGSNGWHAHAHGLLLTNAGGSSAASAQALNRAALALRDQWLAAIEHALDALDVPQTQRAGYRPSAQHAVRLTMAGVGDYLVKGAGPAHADLVPGAGTLTVLDIMERAARGSRRAKRLWAEYTEAMHGRKLVPGLGQLRRKLGLGAPTPAAPTRPERLVACVPARDFNQLARHPEVLAEICREAVALGCRGVAIVAARVLYNVRTWFVRRVPEKVQRLERRFDPAGDPSPDPREQDRDGRERVRRQRRRAIALAAFRARRSPEWLISGPRGA